MFKKKTVKKKPQALRRRRESDSDEEDKQNEDDRTTAQQLEQTRKKRKLLTALQYKRGVDATQLLSSKPGDGNETSETAANNSSANKNANPVVKTAAETSRDGALERRHRQAMEEFIEQRMGKKEQDGSTTKQQETVGTVVVKPLTEDALFMDLAAQSAQLAGKPLDAMQGHDTSVDEERGAVLAAGTGIAEVILPVEERLQVAQETQAAAAAAAASRKQRRGTHLDSAPRAAHNRFAVATNLTAQEFSSQYDRDYNTPATQQQQQDNSGFSQKPTTEADAARPGFDALRQPHKPTTASGSIAKRDQATDHKVYAKFVTRQRELRK